MPYYLPSSLGLPFRLDTEEEKRKKLMNFVNLGIALGQKKLEAENRMKLQKMLQEMQLKQKSLNELGKQLGLSGNIDLTNEEVLRKIGDKAARLEAAGVDHKQAIDDRNALEKFLGLKPGNPWYMDILDLIDRPRNAVMSAIDEAWMSGDLGKTLEAGWEGFTGDRETTGDKLLNDMGMKDGWLRAGLGFVTDVLADPLTYTGLGLLTKVDDAGRVVRMGVSGAINKGIEKAANKAKEVIVTNPITKPIARELDIALGSGGKNWDIFGNYIGNDLKQFEQDLLAKHDYLKGKAIQDSARMLNILGGDFSKGVDVAKIMELESIPPRIKDRFLSLVEQAKDNPEEIQKLIENDPELNKLKQMYTERLALAQNNPELAQAAQIGRQSFQDIRQQFGEIGKEYADKPGYFPHLMTPEAMDFFHLEPSATSRKGFAPDEKIFNPQKDKTVEEINKNPIKLVEDNALVAIPEKQRQLARNWAITSALQTILTDSRHAIPVSKLREMGAAKPKNAVKIDINDFNINPEDLQKLGMKKIEGQYYISRGAYDTLMKIQDLTTGDANLKRLNKVLEKSMRAWRNTALFTVTHHAGNAFGNIITQYIAGMTPKEIAKYSIQAGKELKTVREALLKSPDELTEKEIEALERYNEYVKNGLSTSGQFSNEFHDVANEGVQNAVEYASKTTVKDRVLQPLSKFDIRDPKTYTRLFEASRKLGENIDDVQRYATFLRELNRGKSAKEAADFVRQVHFDWRDVTNFERKVMRNAIPFYTWTRKAIPFILKKGFGSVEGWKRMNRLNNLYKESLAGANINPDEMPSYEKERMAFATPAGFLNLQNPVNVLDTLGALVNPLDQENMAKLAQQSNPLLKTFMEVATNTDVDTQKPLGKPGQLKEVLGTFDVEPSTRALIDNLIPIVGRLDRGIDTMKGDNGQPAGDTLDGLLQAMGLRVTRPIDQDKLRKQFLNELNAKYDEAVNRVASQNDVQDLASINDLKDAGLVENDVVTPQFAHDARALMLQLMNMGYSDNQIRLMLKARQEFLDPNATDKERQQIVAMLQQFGIPQHVIAGLLGQ